MFDDEDAKYFDPEKDLNFDENEEQFPKYYDLEEVFDTMIQPLVNTIQHICNEYDIPMIASFQYKHKKDKTMLCTSAVIPKDRAGARIVYAAQYLTAEPDEEE
jgi:hypothetical protein